MRTTSHPHRKCQAEARNLVVPAGAQPPICWSLCWSPSQSGRQVANPSPRTGRSAPSPRPPAWWPRSSRDTLASANNAVVKRKLRERADHGGGVDDALFTPLIADDAFATRIAFLDALDRYATALGELASADRMAARWTRWGNTMRASPKEPSWTTRHRDRRGGHASPTAEGSAGPSSMASNILAPRGGGPRGQLRARCNLAKDAATTRNGTS